MVLASHYVLKDVLNLLEREKHGRLEEVCTIYRDRYTEDDELLEVFDSILKHISSGESDPKTLMKRLTDLISVRRMEVSRDSKVYF